MERLTGAQIVFALTGKEAVKGSSHSFYAPFNQTVVLSVNGYRGREDVNQAAAAHESAHFWQHRFTPWLFRIRWFAPVNWYLEWTAWRQAADSLRELGQHDAADACRNERRKALTYA